MKKRLKQMWCWLFHRKAWHMQTYTDRARLYEQTACWRCDCNHGKLRLKPVQLKPVPIDEALGMLPGAWEAKVAEGKKAGLI